MDASKAIANINYEDKPNNEKVDILNNMVYKYLSLDNAVLMNQMIDYVNKDLPEFASYLFETRKEFGTKCLLHNLLIAGRYVYRIYMPTQELIGVLKVKRGMPNDARLRLFIKRIDFMSRIYQQIPNQYINLENDEVIEFFEDRHDADMGHVHDLLCSRRNAWRMCQEVAHYYYIVIED